MHIISYIQRFSDNVFTLHANEFSNGKNIIHHYLMNALLFCSTVPTFYSCTECLGSLGIIHDHTPDCHTVSLAWMTSKLNVALIRYAVCVIVVVGLFFDMLSMGVRTNRHW